MRRIELCKKVGQETNNLKNSSTFFYREREREICVLSNKNTLKVHSQEVVKSKHTF